MLAGIQTEIAQLQAEEARRQAQLAAEARARLAAQQRAASTARTQAAELAVDSFTSALDTGSVRSTPLIPAPPPSQYGGVVGMAMQYLGTPYVWGGARPGGFDCSGLRPYVYAQVGVSLPHNAAAQYGYGTPVSLGDLQPGDLVFFDGLGHVGHLHRRRPVHPRPAHRRCRQDLVAERLARRVRRRPPPLARRAVRRPQDPGLPTASYSESTARRSAP